MTDETRSEEVGGPAEERLLSLLGLLREAGRVDDATVERVMHSVRRQHGLKEIFMALNHLALALSGGLSVLLGLGRRSQGTR